MKGNLDNVPVEDRKYYFDFSVKKDIEYLNGLLSRERSDENKKLIEMSILNCREVLKIELTNDADKEVINREIKNYEFAIKELKDKRYDYSATDLKTLLNATVIVRREFEKLASK